MFSPVKNIQKPEVESKSRAFNPKTGRFIPAGPPKFKRFFVVKQFDGDFLTCFDEKGVLHSVALPLSLQESALYDNGQIYTYNGVVADEDDNGNRIRWHSQRIIDNKVENVSPSYLKGEAIIAMHFINDKDPSVRWIDINMSGRSWSDPNSAEDHIAAFKYFRGTQSSEFKKGEWIKSDDGERIYILQDDLPNPYYDDETGVIVLPSDIDDETRTDFAWAVSCGSSACSDTMPSGEYFVPDTNDSSSGSKPFIAQTLEQINAGVADGSIPEFQYSNIWKKSQGYSDGEDYIQYVPYETLFAELDFLIDVDITSPVDGDSVLLFDEEDKVWKNISPIVLTPVDGIPAGADGADGANGADSTVPGPPGPSGANGADGNATVETNGGIELNGSGELFLTTPTVGGGVQKSATGSLEQVYPANPSVSPLNPATIASATEAAYTSNTWTAGSTGVSCYIHVRDGYFDTGDEKIYGYRRLFTYDKYGRLYSIGDEERYVVETPQLIT